MIVACIADGLIRSVTRDTQEEARKARRRLVYAAAEEGHRLKTAVIPEGARWKVVFEIQPNQEGQS